MKVVTTEKLPIKLWLPDEEELPDDAMQQLRNLANLPVARFWVGAMPDCHLGYGMPIGGVLCTKDAVVPNAVGVDIGCGMIAMRLNGLYRHHLDRATLQAWRVATHKRVPVGMASHKEPRPFPGELHDALLSTFPGSISEGLTDLVQRQLGTLGGGNHFIELQYEEGSTSPLADEGSVWLMLHSGSRGLGKAICDHYHKRAKDNMLRRDAGARGLGPPGVSSAPAGRCKGVGGSHARQVRLRRLSPASSQGGSPSVAVPLRYPSAL